MDERRNETPTPAGQSVTLGWFKQSYPIKIPDFIRFPETVDVATETPLNAPANAPRPNTSRSLGAQSRPNASRGRTGVARGRTGASRGRTGASRGRKGASRGRKGKASVSVLAGLAGLVTFVLAVVLARPGTEPPAVPPTGVSAPTPPTAAGANRRRRTSRDRSPAATEAMIRRADFFDRHVQPKIADADRANREAAARCVDRLDRAIGRYHRGVEPFVEDLTSISTRLGIVRRAPGDWWKQDQRIESYVRAKFEQHLFSESELVDDVQRVLQQFRGEVDANGRRLLANVRVSVSRSELPTVELAGYDDFFRSVATQLSRFATRRGTESVYNGLTVLVISEAGSFAATSIVAGLLARFGTAAALSAATTVGTTAGAAGAGAGGGTLAGPVGTAVGFGVGLVAGLAIDWWMTDRFQTEMTAEMNDYLESLRRTILHGRPPGTSYRQADAGGIAEAMPVVCDRLQSAYRESFYQHIIAPEPDS